MVVSRIDLFCAITSAPLYKNIHHNFVFHLPLSNVSKAWAENGIMTGFGLTNFFNRFSSSSSIRQFFSQRSYSLLASDNYYSRCRKWEREREWEMGNMKKLAQCRWWSKVHFGSKRDVLEVMKTLSLLRSHIEMKWIWSL